MFRVGDRLTPHRNKRCLIFIKERAVRWWPNNCVTIDDKLVLRGVEQTLNYYYYYYYYYFYTPGSIDPRG